MTSSPDPKLGVWTPITLRTTTTGWPAVTPSQAIDANSALDASFLLDGPAGKHGFVTVHEGRLAFSKGARGSSGSISCPLRFTETEEADALADRLAALGDQPGSAR